MSNVGPNDLVGEVGPARAHAPDGHCRRFCQASAPDHSPAKIGSVGHEAGPDRTGSPRLPQPGDPGSRGCLSSTRTPLTAIISASKTIADRLDFISGLDQILFDVEPKKQTLERRQLHRILAQETWLFGEESALTGDDERLTAVLKRHLAVLGEEVELTKGPPITREDGTIAIPDLVLSRQVKHHQNVLEHLVVELKRPSVDIGTRVTGASFESECPYGCRFERLLTLHVRRAGRGLYPHLWLWAQSVGV
jgi:hypothetical protein